jgi:hypothetical protein
MRIQHLEAVYISLQIGSLIGRRTLSIISILASLLKVHSFLPICQPPFLSEMTAQGPAYCIPVRADEPGPPFDQRPIGSVSGFEREGKNQKNMEELGR